MAQTWTQTQHVLALSLRTRRFGYAMFEGTKLLDYGICSCGSGSEATAVIASKRLDNLLRLLHPLVMVVCQQSRPRDLPQPDSQSLLQSVKRIAMVHAIDVDYMTYADVRAAFTPFHANTKHDVASVVAGLFPELLPKLPPPRKTWQSEREVMVLFDAVAVGIVHIEKRRGQLFLFL